MSSDHTVRFSVPLTLSNGYFIFPSVTSLPTLSEVGHYEQSVDTFFSRFLSDPSFSESVVKSLSKLVYLPLRVSVYFRLLSVSTSNPIGFNSS